MTLVGCMRLGYRVVVDVDDAVEIVCNNLCNVMQLLEIILAVRDESREGKRSKIANSSLARGRIFDNLGAQVR